LLLVSSKILIKLNFEDYCRIARLLSEDERINIHLLNREKFEECIYGTNRVD